MIKKILLLVVLLIAGILIYAAFRPNSFSVQRSTTIQAPPEKVFSLINDFHNWPEWSPWEKLDPNMKRTLSGPSSGPGAVYAWEGNSKAGQGHMEITESIPSSKVGINLVFIKPMAGENGVDFALQPSGSATNVTWTMSGPMPYVAKVMCLFMSMDKMVGGDFEKGLANLKAAAEK